jgi:hypothetical protein
MIDEARLVRFIFILIGSMGLAIGLGLMLATPAVVKEKKPPPQGFSREKIKEILSRKRSMADILLRRPKFFGLALFMVSFFLLLSVLIKRLGVQP